MSVLARMASFDDDIDFRRVWRVGYMISGVLLLASLGGFVGRGLNLGIDFDGGTSWDVPAAELTADEAADAVESVGQDAAKVQAIGRGDTRTIRVQSDTADVAVQAEVSSALAEAAGVDEADISVSTVGPSWGDQITEKAQRALVIFFVLISLYIAIRLEWKMAVGAFASVVHDLFISVGIYAIFQFEITPATVISFLTILGYSLYDTIVVFDRMQENGAKLTSNSKTTYTDVVSLSLNQVLMRSVNTTITSLLPVLSLLVVGSWIMGAATLQEFALALAVGLLVGAYSSITVASPLVAWMKEREPLNRDLRARAAQRQGPVVGAGRPSPAAPATAEPAGGSTVTEAPPALSGRPIPPRPRKKGKRR
jgi:preprotein translocase subunit SecF